MEWLEARQLLSLSDFLLPAGQPVTTRDGSVADLRHVMVAPNDGDGALVDVEVQEDPDLVFLANSVDRADLPALDRVRPPC